mmetsp:Transcript_25727/g.38690  ORF Transcript_25727/g.38690 Transcript_25727/m.38690 type:complete len:86 (-) Transcript_25727:1458-1715(-)
MFFDREEGRKEDDDGIDGLDNKNSHGDVGTQYRMKQFIISKQQQRQQQQKLNQKVVTVNDYCYWCCLFLFCTGDAYYSWPPKGLS